MIKSLSPKYTQEIFLSSFHSVTTHFWLPTVLKFASILFPLIASCLSWVPEQGTVGASGDLAPLAHLALGLMGEGHMWSPETGWGDAKYVSLFVTVL